MKPISIGKLRGLQQISSKRGTFTVLALDHRQNLRKAKPAFVNDAELSRFKLEVTQLLASRATAVLLDPEVSAAQAVAACAIPTNIGLVVAVESTGYTGETTARHAQIIAGRSVEKAKRMGASAIKLLVYYHPDACAAKQLEDFTARIGEDCIVPWILLSAAVEYGTFLRQATVACHAGASVVAVGRAVWKEAVNMTTDDRIEFLRTTTRQRISRLTSVCHALAKPSTDFYTVDAPFDWHKAY